jgi:hypothetical protein
MSSRITEMILLGPRRGGGKGAGGNPSMGSHGQQVIMPQKELGGMKQDKMELG